MPTQEDLEQTLSNTEGRLIGRVTHYFPHVGAAVLELNEPLKVGDTIRIVGGQVDFTQQVESMEIDRKKVNEAKPGEAVAVLVKEKVREGYRVYKL